MSNPFRTNPATKLNGVPTLIEWNTVRMNYNTYSWLSIILNSLCVAKARRTR